ncbi:MAG: hypothetical protein HYT35_00445 [Candidatus Staskawiczbacteria bacterium]|nr:hypothetical protein [Candidatus Staskawiczbacteria bacterium]
MQFKKHAIEKKIEPSSKYLRLFFFLSGIIATVAYRIIFLLDSFWIEVAWYVGTVGFILYFGHRTSVENKRAQLVRDYKLVEVLRESDINEEEKSALSYLIETSLTSKARFNSVFIFILSLLAFIVSVIIDIYYFLFQ